MRRLLTLIALFGACAALAVPAALADGDPASDILYFQDEFLPYAKPSADLTAQVQSAVTAANQAGFRIKLAVISSQQDLGAVPSLFNQPQLYARFLGTALRSFYTNRLLVVMPSGFGIFNNNGAVTSEQEILAQLKIEGPDPDSLVRAAIEAIAKLREGAGGKNSGPPPTVKAFPAKGSAGKAIVLKYTVSSATGKSKEEVRVYGPNLVLYAVFKKPLLAATAGTARTVTWKPAKTVSKAGLKFCVLAQNAAGGQSRPACAPIKLT